MKLVIEMDLDNAAFEDGGADEVARILASIGERIPDPLATTGGDLSLHDANGNHCGFARIEDGADAKLRRAAPELLAACKAAIEWHNRPPATEVERRNTMNVLNRAVWLAE